MRTPALTSPDDWPAADHALWQTLTAPAAGPLDDAGALAQLRPTSLGMIADPYGRWLSWLLGAVPEAMEEPPARRVTPERLMAWVGSTAHLAPMTRKRRVEGVLRLARAIAPDADWTRQQRVAGQLHRVAARHHGSRKQGRILSSDVLLQAGLDLAGPHAEVAPTLRRAMVCRRDGLMVAFLALLPLRLTSFHTLELGRSVLREKGRWVIAVPGERMKAGRPWETPLPPVLDEIFTRYVDEVRPWLMARGSQTHDWLWVGIGGQPLTKHRLRLRIGDVTEAMTGVRVPPHFFRDAAATTLVRTSPTAARLVRALLAHASFATAEKHYLHAQGIEAGRDYVQVLDRLKRGSGR